MIQTGRLVSTHSHEAQASGLPRFTTRLHIVLVFVASSQPTQNGKRACHAEIDSRLASGWP